MFNLLHAHWKKTKRTFLRPMLVFLPVIYSLMIFTYFFVSKNRTVYAENEYAMFFLLLALSIQFVSGTLIVLFVNLDKQAGNFGNELTIGVPRSKLLLSKCLFLFLLLLGVEFIATTTFILAQIMVRGSWIGFSQLGSYLFFIPLLMLPQLFIYLWVSYPFHMTGTLIVSSLSFLTAVLMGTTDLGTGIWIFIPPVWLTRVVFGLIPVTSELTQSYQEISLLKMIPTALIVSCILFLGLCFWYNNWEGQGRLEE